MKQWKARGMSFWRARTQRERGVLSIGLMLLLAVLVWLVLLDPAWQGRAQLQKELPVLREQRAQLQSMAREVTKAANSAAVPASTPTPLSRQMLESSLAQKSLRAQSLEHNGELVRLKLSDASFAALVEWLGEMQNNRQLVVTDANVVATEKLDKVNATLSLRQQK